MRYTTISRYGHHVYNVHPDDLVRIQALLLSHPSPQIRDTQSLAYKHHLVKSRRPALRVLVKQELGIVIQGGEHSSVSDSFCLRGVVVCLMSSEQVTDARATMALFRLYKKQWESGFRSFHMQSRHKADDDPESKAHALDRLSPSSNRGRKRKHSDSSKLDGDDDADDGSGHISTISQRRKQRSRSPPPADSAQRKGISSGITTVTKRAGIKEVRRKGARTGDDGEKGNVGEKWWKSLGGGKKGGIKL